MPGRRRRQSSSSTETVNERGIRYRKETSVLKRRPDNVDSDDWPIFELRDAIVYEKHSERMTNALEATLKGPFLVRGCLDASSKDQEKRLVKPITKPAYIEIQNSPRYCIGDEPQPVVWVEGAAGWYEIQPHAKYAAIYEKSCEGIRLYYIIMSIYEKAIGKNATDKQRQRICAKYDLDDIFFKYALAIGDGVVKDEVIARCDAHAAFLLDQFPQEGYFDWKDTSFFKWMQSRHADLQEQIRRKAAQRPAVEQEDDSPDSSDEDIDPSGGQTTGVRPSQDIEMADAINEPLSLRTKSRAKSSSTAEGTPQPPTAAGATTTTTMLLDVFEEIAQEYDPRGPRAKLSTIASKVYYKCKIRDKHSVQEIIAYFAKDLVLGLSPMWQGTVSYAELEDLSRSPRIVPRLIQLNDIPNQLRRRVKYNKNKKGQPDDSDSHSKGSARIKREPLNPSGGRLSGKAARLRLASTSNKRYREEMVVDNEDEMESGPDKKTKTLHFVEDDTEEVEQDEDQGEEDDSIGSPTRKEEDGKEEEEEEADDSDDEGTPNDDNDDDVEVDSEVESGDKLVQHIITSHPLPSTKPTGPNGAWVCQELACRHMVRAAATDEGQAKILEHIRSHGDEDSKVKLALEEGQRNRAATSHLIEKLRAAGTSSLDRERRYIDDEEVPLPVQRHPMFNI